MPPQQTSSTGVTEVDAARLRLDVFGLIGRYCRAFLRWSRRQTSDVALQDLNDRQLMDIGLSRGEMDYVTPGRAIERLRDNTMQLWGRGG